MRFLGMWNPTQLNFLFGKVGNLRFWKRDKSQPHLNLHQIKNIYLKVETKCSIKLKNRKEKRLRTRIRTYNWMTHVLAPLKHNTWIWQRNIGNLKTL